MNEERLHKLWENTGKLNKDFTIDYDTFKNDMGDQEKRHRFYDSVRRLNPKFTLTNEEVDNDLGFANDVTEPAVEQELSGWQKFKNVIKEPNLFGSFGGTRKQGDKVIDQREEDIYLTTGMTDQDQQDAAALKRVEKEHPFLNKGSVSPVDISEETEATLNKKSEMSSYVQRGDAPETIYMNAFERAMNTEEGKNYYNTLLNEAENEFINSDEYKALIEQYKLGQVTEEEIYQTFSEKYEDGINKKFEEKMLAKGTPLGNYLEIAEKRVYMKYGASDALRLEGEIDAALEKSKEGNDKFREEYKKHFGVYPEDDPMSDLKAKALQQSGSLGYRNQYDRTLLRAKKFNTEALTLINAVSKKDDFGDFWRGVGDAATDLDTWDFGIGELTRNVELLNVIKKLEHNETAPADQQLEITESEHMLLDAALNFFTVSAYYSNELGRGYKAGQTSMASLPFMLEFVLSYGTMAAVDASVKGTVRAGTALLVKQLRKRGMQKLAKVTTGKVSHMVGSMASGIVSSAINAAYMTGVYGGARIAGGTVERMTGQVTPEWDPELNRFVYNGREDAQEFGEALWNSTADTYIENLSEMVLAKTLDPMRAFIQGTDVFKKIAKNDLIGAISSIRNNPTFKSLRQATQFGGYFEEVAEEYLGGILRRVAMTDVNSWKEAGLDIDGQIDIFLGLAPTSILFGATGAASYYGGIAYNSKKLKESMSSEAERQMFDQLMKESRAGEFKEGAHDFIRSILLDGNISEERKREIIIGVARQYQAVLSENLQEQSRNVATAEFEREIDSFVSNGSLSGTESIITSTDEQGRAFVIVDGSIHFKEDETDEGVIRTIDSTKSSREIQVRYLKNDGTLTEEIVPLRATNITNPIEEINAKTFKEFKLAQYSASFASLDTFEYNGGIYDTKTGLFIRTKEEQEQINNGEQQVEEGQQQVENDVQQPTDAPAINTKPRIIVNEEHKVTVDGKQVTVKLTSIAGSPLVQREDGSIKSGDFVVTVDGKSIRNKEAKKDYIDAVSEKLKADHAKAVEEYNKKKEEEAAANAVEPQPIISEEDRAARDAELARQAKEAEKQTILKGRKQDKTGDIDMDKLTPEETVLTYMEEETPESLMQLLTEQLQYLHSQVASIQEKELSPVEKKNKIRKVQKSITAYEEAIAKWIGEDALASINASQEITPPAPVVAEEPAPVAEEPAVEEPAPAIEEQLEEEGGNEVVTETEEEEPVAEEPEVEEEETEEPIIDINNIAVYRRNISGNNSDMYRFVQKGEEGQEDGVEDLFQVTDGGRKKKRTDKFSRMDNAKTGYIDNNKDKPCIILDINQQEGYANVLTNYGVQQMPLERVYQSEKEGVTLRGSNPRLENDAKYTTFESLMSMPLVHVGDRNGLTITVKDVIDGARSKKPYSTIEEQVKIAVEKFAPKNADIDALVSDSMSEFRKSFNEAARLWNNITTASNLGNSRIKSAMTKDSKHNPILEIRKSFAELSKINNERIEAGEDSIFSVELIDSFTAVDTSTAFISKEITELSVPEMIEYAKDIFHALQNADIVPSEFKTLLNEVLSYLCRKPTKNGNVDHMRHKRNAFMKELGIKAEAEGGVYKDILKEALRKKALKEASKYLVSENLVTELSEEDSASQENAKQPQEKEEKKEKPAKKPASKVTTALMDSVVSLSVRVNNESLPKLQRDLAKAALADKLDKLSPEETLELYNMMIAERNVSQGVMVEDITKAMELVESSKKGAIITQERERIMAAIEAAQAVEEEKVEETETPDIDFEALIAERNELEDNLPDMSDDEIVAANTRIAEINEILSNQAELMVDEKVQESRKAAKVIINLLKKAGVRVVEVTEQQIEQMIGSDEYKKLTADGIVYGAAHKGIIYLNSEHLNPNTPLHEFTHLWVDWYKNEFKEEWERFVKLAVKSKVAKQLKTKEAYKKLNDSDLASEVLSRYTGYTYGAMTEEEKSEFENLMNTTGSIEEQIAEKPLLKAIREFWKRIISIFDKTVLEVKEEEAIDDMIRRFSKLPMLTLIRGKEAVDEMKEMAKKGTMVVYHGTAAEFSQFDHDFMGTGEGAQAYGWGTYVSQVKDIAVSYAKADANRKKYSKEPENPFDKISEPDLYVLFNNYIRAFEAGIDMDSFIKDMRWTIVQHIEGLIRKYDKYLVLSTPSFGMSVASIRNAVFVLRETGESYANSAMGHTLLKYADAIESMADDIEAYENMQKHKEDKDRFFNALNKSIVNAERHLYTVEIPAESYTENGKIDIENSPYLGWDDWYPNDSNVARAIVRALSKMSNELMTELENTPDPTYGHIGISLAERFITNKDIVGLYEDRYITNDIREKVIKYIELNSIIDRNLNYGGFYGKELYSELHDIFGRDELKSKWLLSQGIVGIRVSTNATSGNVRDTKNYVIFNEADAQIVDHIKFMTGKSAENLDNSKKSSNFAANNENYERTKEFRELQERSLGLSQSRISEYQSGRTKLSDEDRRRVGGIFQRLMESERNGGRNAEWTNLTGKGSTFKVAQVNPAIFHDVFQICRNYLPNGELVDLHDSYADCKCFISEDGLCGFAIEPNGNLISVFSLNPSDKRGFLYAIKDLIRQEGATHLDCYVSNKQPLAEIYEKALGFYVASEMDYNMEYDHDNIAENHGMPKVAFMVDRRTEKRSFDGESYDAAYEYQQSQTSIAEREQIVSGAKANGTYMLAPNGQPTNLTEDQWVTVRTQAFKDYFGDWQNDPANASVVVDENGEPMVVYHGSRMAGFDKFGRDVARDSQGIYTTPNRRAAESYATSVEEWRSEQTMPEAEIGVSDQHGVYSLFVNMRNPKVIDFGGKRFDEYGETKYEVATNEALDYGERGIIFDTLEEAEAYIAEHPEEDLDYVEKRTTSDELLVEAKEEEYDGVIFTNIIDSRYPDPITNYVPFDSNQVKSATQNIGTFNAEDDRIQFMIGPSPSTSTSYDSRDGMTIDAKVASKLQVKSKDYMAALANPRATLPQELNAWNNMVATLFDRTEGIRVMMESINKFRKEHGLPKMAEGFDVRTLVEAMDSKIANETRQYVETKENELRKCIYELAKKVKESDFYKKYKYEQQLDSKGKRIKLSPREIIERYLIACDSIEREELRGNPRGLGDFLNRMGVDVVQYRDEFLQAFASTKEGREEINKLWDAVRGVTDVVITEGERSGLLSKDEIAEYRKRRFYVPERDFAEVEADEDLRAIYDAGVSTGGRMGNKLLAEQRAKGGDTLAANVLANMTLLARDAIVKANKNIVKVAMFDLLRSNEEWCRAKHIPIPRQIWYVKNDKGKYVRQDDGPSAADRKLFNSLKYEIRMREDEILLERQLAEAATVPVVKQGHLDNIEEIQQEIESLRDALPYLDEFDTRDLAFHHRGTLHEYTVTVFVDGIPCEMNFPNMTSVANALNGKFNKTATAEVAKKLTNALSATMTVYNPAFFTVNVVRDVPFILAKGYAEYGWKFAPKFIAQLGKTALKADVWKVIWSGDYKNAKDKYVREFFEGGGNTGYGTIPDINRLKKKWESWGMQGVQITLSRVGDVISYMNTFSEVWTRLAAYSVVRDMGGTKEDGIRAAKNLSVNFNRRGLGAPLWNEFLALSFFANAAMQGASGFIRAFHGNKDTTKSNAAVAFRAANAFMFTPMFAGFISTLLHPDDDDELLKYSDWDRDNYWYIGDKGFRFALNEQIKPFWVIGVNIALCMKGKRTKEDAFGSVLSSVFTNLIPATTNVTGSLTMLVQGAVGIRDYSVMDAVENLFVPQAYGHIVDLTSNADFMGFRIRPESGDLPAYLLNENSAALFKEIAEQMYDIYGGDQILNTTHIEVIGADGTITYRKMKYGDISPKQAKVFSSPFVNTSVQDLCSLIINAKKGDLGKPTDYVTIKRFYKPAERETLIFETAKKARAIIKEHDEHIRNMERELGNAILTKNEEKREAARTRIRQLKGNRDIKELKMYLNAYDATTIYTYAKQFNLSEEKFIKELKVRNPDMADAFENMKSTKQDVIIRKMITLTRDIQGQ